MPIYYFDLKDGTRVRDHGGVDFANDVDAIAHGKELAAQIAQANPDYDGPPLFVSVIHEDGREVSRLQIYGDST